MLLWGFESDIRGFITMPIRVLFISTWGFFAISRMRDLGYRWLTWAALACMLFWTEVQWARYAFDWLPVVDRLFWYFYYAPMLGAPLALALASRLAVSERQVAPAVRTVPLCVATAAVFVLVLSNDLHGLVFDIDYAAEGNFTYTYRFGYYLVMGWIAYLLASSVYVLQRYCLRRGIRPSLALPTIVMIAMMVYFAIYVYSIVTFKHGPGILLIDAFIVLVVLTMEALTAEGLIPSNTQYGRMISCSQLEIALFDQDVELLTLSQGLESVPLSILQSQVRQGGSDTRVTRTRVERAPFGYVLWREDVSALNSMLDQLTNIKEELTAADEILVRENALKARAARVKIRSELYDRIVQETSGQLATIDDMLDDVVESPQMAYDLLKYVCVLGSYVKRRSNLLLMAEGANALNVQELAYCFRESAEALRICGVRTSYCVAYVGPAPVVPAPVGPAPVGPAPVGPAPVGPAPVGPAPVASDYHDEASQMVAVSVCIGLYDQFQKAIEANFKGLISVDAQVSVTESFGELKLTVELDPPEGGGLCTRSVSVQVGDGCER